MVSDVQNSGICLVAGHFVFTGIYQTFTGLATQGFFIYKPTVTNSLFIFTLTTSNLIF